MRYLTYSFILTFFIATSLTAQAKKDKKDIDLYSNNFPAYVIYNSAGEKISYTEMMKGLSKKDICLFGEFHDDPISHWLEKVITENLAAEKGQNLVLGGEMWETDQQLLMDELLSGMIDKKSYTEAANNWPNFNDYKPLVGIAIKNNLRFICTNIPRRYANIIYKKGEAYLDSLPQQAYQYLPPLPIHYDLEQPAYASMLGLFADDDSSHNSSNPMAKYKGTNLVKAQAIKDATMAYNILKNWEKGKYFMHYNGVYHSKYRQSIVYYLNYYNPDVEVATISVSRQENVLNLQDENNTGDYNIVVQEQMTKTYQ
ncbi:ChaN family lipoprotein [Mangrovibacterium sp.]|uniref:ChaN family lipoprotein n=1 Tax=Mangrovibacterium sp. TaxID=1961364 RepID=UPI0035663A50